MKDLLNNSTSGEGRTPNYCTVGGGGCFSFCRLLGMVTWIHLVLPLPACDTVLVALPPPAPLPALNHCSAPCTGGLPPHPHAQPPGLQAPAARWRCRPTRPTRWRCTGCRRCSGPTTASCGEELPSGLRSLWLDCQRAHVGSAQLEAAAPAQGPKRKRLRLVHATWGNHRSHVGQKARTRSAARH